MTIFNCEECPEDAFVMTSWHENEPLHETFLFSGLVTHPTLELEITYIVHIAHEGRATELLEAFRAAQKTQ